MKDINIKKIQPTRGYVLVEPAKAEQKTSSGIILPENDSEKPQYGTVLAVGESDCSCDCSCGDSCCSDSCSCDNTYECGESCDCEEECSCSSAPAKVGDQVIYKKWGGNEFKIGDTEYQFLKFEDVLAVINK